MHLLAQADPTSITEWSRQFSELATRVARFLPNLLGMLAILIVVRHRNNLIRLAQGREAGF